MDNLENRIKSLRSEGKTYSQIQEILGCSKSTISYYLSPNGKQRVQDRTRKRREEKALERRIEVFKSYPMGVSAPKIPSSTVSHRLRGKVQKFHQLPDGTEPSTATFGFTVEDVRKKFGDSPTCYLTGDSLSYDDLSNLSFDHIHPRSRGGDNSLENLGLTSKLANSMKSNMTVDELLDMCEKMLKHHGRL